MKWPTTLYKDKNGNISDELNPEIIQYNYILGINNESIMQGLPFLKITYYCINMRAYLLDKEILGYLVSKLK